MRALLLVLALCAASSADVTRPVYLGLTELREGQFEVTWRVPRRGDRVLAVGVRFPAAFRETTPRTVALDADAQTTRWTVEANAWDLPGAVIAFEGPGRSRVDVMVRFEFRDGTVVVRVLPPEALECRFPSRMAAHVPADEMQRAAIAGARYVVTSAAFLAFLIGLALCGRARVVVVALGLFALGQLGGVALGIPIPPAVAHGLLGIAAAVAAAAALRFEYRGLGAMALVCGLAHGAVQPGGYVGAIGADAAALTVSLTVLFTLPARWKPAVGYCVGAAGIALALIEATTVGPVVEPTPQQSVLLAPAAKRSEGAASAPVAGATDAPVQLFLEVTPFETRVECVARVAALGVGDRKDVAISEQPELKRRVHALFAQHVAVLVDGSAVSAADTRIDFVTRETGGVLERVEPVVEKVDEALVGIALSFPTAVPPSSVTLRWQPLPGVESVPAVIVDPKHIRSAALDAGNRELQWSDALSLPPVRAVAVRERVTDVSLLWIGLVAVGGFALFRRFGRGGGVVARLLLAGACCTAPYLRVAVPLPGEDTPSRREVSDVMEALLTNIYRGLDQPDESAAYDRLRISVTEDALRPIYLEQRRTLELGRRGGARARVDSVEMARVQSIESVEGGRLRTTVAWEAAGFVVHYGHRHFRQNRYEAEVELLVENGSWKFGRLAVVDKERLR